MKTLESKVRSAAVRYLEMTDREVLDSDFLGYIITKDDEGIAVNQLEHTCEPMDSWSADTISRSEFEKVIYKFMVDNPDVCDVSVRLDLIEVFIVHADRAIIRHCVDVKFDN